MKDNKLIYSVLKDPLTVLLLGAFPAMAATGSLKGALVMGLAVTLAMVISGVIISLLRNTVTEGMFLPVSTALSCFLAVAFSMLVNAWFPGAYEQLGIALSLLSVALLLYGNNACAYEKVPAAAAKNAVLTGLFYTAVLAAVALVRELFGSGSVFGAELGFMKSLTCAVFAQPAGGFMVYAFAAAAVKKLFAKKETVEAA